MTALVLRVLVVTLTLAAFGLALLREVRTLGWRAGLRRWAIDTAAVLMLTGLALGLEKVALLSLGPSWWWVGYAAAWALAFSLAFGGSRRTQPPDLPPSNAREIRADCRSRRLRLPGERW